MSILVEGVDSRGHAVMGATNREHLCRVCWISYKFHAGIITFPIVSRRMRCDAACSDRCCAGRTIARAKDSTRLGEAITSVHERPQLGDSGGGLIAVGFAG